MKYIRKNGIKDPGSAITHGIALVLAIVGALPLILKAARGTGMAAYHRNDGVYAEYDPAVYGKYAVSYV